MTSCKFKCIITDDKRLVHTADAVVSHIRDIETRMPKQVKQNQLRVLLSREPPSVLSLRPAISPNIYNWTFTYRLDSDVPITWGYYELKKNISRTSKDLDNFTSESHFNEYQARYLPPERRRLVAWIVSNCKTQSRRENYVAELMKYIPVDIYGRCGPLKCKYSRQDGCHKNVCESCYVELAKTYKFVLAFENSLCLDYVTEKLFDTLLSTDFVPIVYGAVNYSKVAPPKSYIDTAAFQSVKDLANYLLYLDKNPREYLKYLLWKKRYRVASSRNRWCDLCKHMTQVSVLDKAGNRIIDPKYTKYHQNITRWWWFEPANQSRLHSTLTPVCRSLS